MNNIANFRLCKLSDSELLKKVDSGCDKMYETGKIPDRHIPAKPENDFDLILGELILRFDEKAKASESMEKIIGEMTKYTDLFPWYWISYGQGEYAYSVVEAYPANDNDSIPEPGTELEIHEDERWYGENGVEMVIMSSITEIEKQNGDTICQFIAMAHSFFLKDKIEGADK